jgi:hypothetical protein
MDEAELRDFRHELRGRWHGLRLCVEALGTCTAREDILEFLDAIINSADEVRKTLEDMPETDAA